MCDVVGSTPSNGNGMSSFADELVVALMNARIYGTDHPRLRETIGQLLRRLEDQFESLGRTSLVLGAADGYLFFDQRPLLGASRSAPRLLRVLEGIGSGGISFGRGVEEEELMTLIRFLARNRGDEGRLADVNARLEQDGVRHLRFLPGYVVNDGEGGWALLADANAEGSTEPEDSEAVRQILAVPELDARLSHILAVPRSQYDRLFEHLTEVMTKAIEGRALGIRETHDHVHTILERSQAMLNVSDVTGHAADQFQFRHSIRMAALAVYFAKHLTRDEEMLLRIGTAALLHDVGKARVDWNVFHAEGRLTDAGFVEMSRHPEYGAQILLEQGDADPLSVAVALGHHRTMTNAGYPILLHRLGSEDVSLGTRIVKICDVYEALTGDRDYRDSASPVKAYGIMLTMGDHFDRALLNRFIHVMGIYPTDTWVELEGGEIGWVESQTEDLRSPVVRVTHRRAGDEVVPAAARVQDPRRTRTVFPVVRWFRDRPSEGQAVEPDPIVAASE